MASRPLPPGRRGRGGRAAPSLHLPEAKILSDEAASMTTTTFTSHYIEQVRAETTTPLGVEPEHESTTKGPDFNPPPVRSVKAFVSSLEKGELPQTSIPAAAAAAGEEMPTTHADVSEAAVHMPPAVSSAVPMQTPEPATVTPPPTATSWQVPAAFEQVPVPKSEPAVPVAPVRPTPQVPVQPPVEQVHAPPQPIEQAPQPIEQAVAAPVVPLAPVGVSTPAPAVSEPNLDGFHPFKLLFPIYAVPEIPETIDCVYDDEAVEMQKNIMKTVKKIFGKDRTKLEDFKINSRLYGNNFMDPHEYIESLVEGLGGNRTLLLIPCLVSIQPDYMKRSSMLVAARNYRLRHLVKLEAALDKAVVEEPVSVPPPVHMTSSSVTVAPTASVTSVDTTRIALEATTVVAAAVVVDEAVTSVASKQDEVVDLRTDDNDPAGNKFEVPPTSTPIQDDHVEGFVGPTVKEVVPETVVAAISEPQTAVRVEPVASAVSEPQGIETVLVEPIAPIQVDEATRASVEAVHDRADTPALTPEPITLSSGTPVKSEPSPNEQPTSLLPNGSLSVEHESSVSAVVTPTPTLSEPSSTNTVASLTTTRPTKRRGSSVNIFGEEIGDSTDTEDESSYAQSIATSNGAPAPTPASAAAPPPVSSYEAESLFGEVIPISVKPVPASPVTTTPSVVPPPPARSGMLFGTAGATSDSESDSEFND